MVLMHQALPVWDLQNFQHLFTLIYLVHVISKGSKDLKKKPDRELFLSVHSCYTISYLRVIGRSLAINSLPDGKLLYVSESLSPLAYTD